MGKIALARVDERLIHGQVMTKWVTALEAEEILLIDDATAEDAFMKSIYEKTGERMGLQVKVYSVDQAIAQWQADQFGEHTVFLLFANIDTVIRAEAAGIPISVLNLGGLVKTTDEQVHVNNAVALSPKMIEQLDALAAKGVEIYLRTVPDSGRMAYEEARAVVLGK